MQIWDPGFMWSFSLYPRGHAFQFVTLSVKLIFNVKPDLVNRVLGQCYEDRAELLRQQDPEQYDDIVEHYRSAATSYLKAAEMYPKDDEYYPCE